MWRKRPHSNHKSGVLNPSAKEGSCSSDIDMDSPHIYSQYLDMEDESCLVSKNESHPLSAVKSDHKAIKYQKPHSVELFAAALPASCKICGRRCYGHAQGIKPHTAAPQTPVADTSAVQPSENSRADGSAEIADKNKFLIVIQEHSKESNFRDLFDS